MANLLWGKVYYKEHFAGYLRAEPGEGMSFTYDPSYLIAGHPAIAHTLPLQAQPLINQVGLHPFFDNLVAEGWLEGAQARLLGRRIVSRFELLLAFGQDCAGAISVIDPEPQKFSQALLDLNDPRELALMAGRASISGVQPKLTLVERKGKFYPARIGELSTHIAKFPSLNHSDLITNEYLTMLAFKALLPEDEVADLWIGEVQSITEPVLIIKRFDRTANNDRIHFEEFNQLLGYPSQAKYDGAYKDMADFILDTKNCLPVEVYRLYLRILAGLLLGNTDMHLKNFAMFHTPAGFRLTPVYDQVAAAIYNYKSLALAVGGTRELSWAKLKARSVIKLGEEFRLSKPAVKMACDHLAKNIEAAKQVISDAKIGTAELKNQIIKLLESRWNGTFALIGPSLLKKP